MSTPRPRQPCRSGPASCGGRVKVCFWFAVNLLRNLNEIIWYGFLLNKNMFPPGKCQDVEKRGSSWGQHCSFDSLQNKGHADFECKNRASSGFSYACLGSL